MPSDHTAPPQRNRRAIVLVVDRLNPSQIGAYGNTCHETESINRIASQSLLFDHAVAPLADLNESYHQLMAMPSGSDAAKGATWLAAINATEASTEFCADRDWLTSGSAIAKFEGATTLPVKPLDRLASRVSQTGLARFFAQAVDRIENMSGQGLLWLDCSGLDGQWDAPHGLRCEMADPDDPVPPEFFQRPSFIHDTNHGDPDVLLGVQQSADAQVKLLDDFIGVVIDLIQQPDFEDTLFCLASLRGFPLGQHGIVGPLDPSSEQAVPPLKFGYNEMAHVPLMVCLPPSVKDSQSIRSGKLVTPLAVPQLIEAWVVGDDQQVDSWLAEHSSLPEPDREIVWFQNEAEFGVQTHAWKFLQNSQTEHCELYAKPDDLWEVNDVSKRCPNEVRLFRELGERLLADSNLIHRDDFRLPPELVTRHG